LPHKVSRLRIFTQASRLRRLRERRWSCDKVVEVVDMARSKTHLGSSRLVVAVAAVSLCFLPLLSGCAFFFGELVGVGAGAAAGTLTKSPTEGAAGGAAAGAGGGALVGYMAGAPLAGAIGGALSGGTMGYFMGMGQSQSQQ
jgi:hypothetical protein